jgi:hypothetical protein
MSLQSHLQHTERDIAIVIEECVKVLDQQGLDEEVWRVCIISSSK